MNELRLRADAGASGEGRLDVALRFNAELQGKPDEGEERRTKTKLIGFSSFRPYPNRISSEKRIWLSP